MQTMPDLICLACSHSQGEIAARKTYEQSSKTPPTCNKTCAQCHSGGESFIWKEKHMTRVFFKGEAGSKTAPILLYGICRYCDKAMKCPPKFGISNLGRHLEGAHHIYSPCKRQRVMTSSSMTKGKGVALSYS